MDFHKIARETVRDAQTYAGEPQTPDRPQPNCVVVTFSNSDGIWTIKDNGEEVTTTNFDEAVRIVHENLEQAA
jgi:hypothetical protein